jgi:hypothetical protein
VYSPPLSLTSTPTYTQLLKQEEQRQMAYERWVAEHSKKKKKKTKNGKATNARARSPLGK